MNSQTIDDSTHTFPYLLSKTKSSQIAQIARYSTLSYSCVLAFKINSNKKHTILIMSRYLF